MSRKDVEDVYQKLRRHLDQLPIGLPSATSGVEIRLLKHFFTPEEAELATHLAILPQARALRHFVPD